MTVEERVERDTAAAEHHEPKGERRPSDAQQAAVVEAAYILEALRK